MYSANAPLQLAFNRLRQFLGAPYPLKQAASNHASGVLTALHPERKTQAERLPLCAKLTPLFPHWPVALTQAPELEYGFGQSPVEKLAKTRHDSLQNNPERFKQLSSYRLLDG